MKRVSQFLSASLLAVGALSALSGCTRPAAPLSEPCAALYRSLFAPPAKDAGRVRIALFFGYKDSRPARLASDRYEAAAFGDALEVDGWKRVERRPESDPKNLAPTEIAAALPIARYERKITLPIATPPLPEPHERVLELSLFTSSVGADDGINRKDPYQRLVSENVQKAFLSALGTYDWVLYDGHSRDGGGPDFAPPLLVGTHVDYPAYERLRARKASTLDAVLSALRTPAEKKGGLRYLGIYSCASTQHFKGAIRAAAPQARLGTSPRLLYWSDALLAMRELFLSLNKGQCPPQHPSGDAPVGIE